MALAILRATWWSRFFEHWLLDAALRSSATSGVLRPETKVTLVKAPYCVSGVQMQHLDCKPSRRVPAK